MRFALLGMSLVAASLGRRRLFSSVVSDKIRIRESVRVALTKIEESKVREQSTRVGKQVADSRSFRDAEAVCLYLSMDKEIDTEPILKAAFDSGKRVFLPRVVGSDIRMYETFGFQDIQSFGKSKYGNIREPPSDYRDANKVPQPRAQAVDCGAELGLIVVPGLAFDDDCRRLGHGKGFYDRFLTALRSQRALKGLPMPRVVGLALSTQRVTRVPTSSEDFVLDEVVFGSA